MPDPEKLKPSQKAKLLGCIAAKNRAWLKKHQKNKIPVDINRKHFDECSKSLGYH